MQTQLKAVHARFSNFLFLVWKHLDLPPPTAMQYEIADYLQFGPRRSMIQAFRGIGKSWITAAFALWLLLRNPQLKILIVSASKDRSDAFSVFVKRLISDMPILRHLKAKAGQRDSSVSFDVGPALPAQAPSLKAVGITGQMTGSRADIIIADDVEVPKNSLTQLMRDRLSEAIKEFDAILSTKRELNRVLYLGTPQTEMSIYKDLPERGFDLRTWTARYPDGARMKRMRDHLAPSITDALDKNPLLAGRPTDSRFTEEDLGEREASYGRSGFSLQFMLDTTVSDAERYPLKLADLIVHDVNNEQAPIHLVWGSGPDQIMQDLDAVGLTSDRYHRPIKISSEWTKYTGSVMYIDPSGRGADETSFAVIKYLGGMLHLTRVGGFKDGYSPATLDALALVAKNEAVNEVIIEPNYGGGMFNELFKPMVNRVYPKCGVEEAPWAKGQKEVRIIDILEPVMNQHRLVVARSCIEDDLAVAKDNPKFSAFYQMTRITKERGALAHDDRLEAIAGAVAHWVDSMSRDEQKAEESHKGKLMDAELKKFAKHVLGRKPKPKSLLRRR